MLMGDRPYRTFLRSAERFRSEVYRTAILTRRAAQERLIKAAAGRRRAINERAASARDARAGRNKGVARFHEAAAREAAKRKDEDRRKRMEALASNDVDAYRAMLEAQGKQEGAEGSRERFEVLSQFLEQTEEYLRKLGGKIAAVKDQQEIEEAAQAAAAAARAKVRHVWWLVIPTVRDACLVDVDSEGAKDTRDSVSNVWFCIVRTLGLLQCCCIPSVHHISSHLISYPSRA